MQTYVVFVFCLNGMFHFGMFQQPIFPRFFKQKALRYLDFPGGKYNLGARFPELLMSNPPGSMPPEKSPTASTIYDGLAGDWSQMMYYYPTCWVPSGWSPWRKWIYPINTHFFWVYTGLIIRGTSIPMILVSKGRERETELDIHKGARGFGAYFPPGFHQHIT